MRLLLLLLTSVLLFSSCKKDLIRARSITRLESYTVNRLNSILFINDSVGFVAGGSRFYEADVLITRDGGHTWDLYVSPEANKEMFGITQSPTGAIYVIGFDGNLLRSYDEGRTWLRSQLRFQYLPALPW